MNRRQQHNFLQLCPGEGDTQRWFDVLRAAPYPFDTWNTAYNFATGKAYQGRNVTRLCNLTRARHLGGGVIYLTEAQAERLGGRINETMNSAEVVLLRHVLVLRGTEEEGELRRLFLKKSSGVFHYRQLEDVPPLVMKKKMERIQKLERATQCSRAMPTFRKYWPNEVVKTNEWPSDLFFKQVLTNNAFHALVTSIELCREAKVTWTVPDHPGVVSCLEALEKKPTVQHLRMKLYRWRRPEVFLIH